MARMKTTPFGPWPKGLIDRANPSDVSVVAGALRRMRGMVYSGGNRLTVRAGDAAVMTLLDDVGANATTVCAITPFTNMTLAVAYSSSTQKAYVYQIAADFSGWFDSGGTFHGTTFASPSGTLWSGMTTAPDVTIAEGLGVAYIAMNAAVSASVLAFPTMQFTPPSSISSISSDLDGQGATPMYGLGTVSFQQHLWIWGWGSGATPVNGYRPELARFSQPVFTLPFQPSDSITVGDRVRSQREQIVAAAVAGQSLFLATPFSMTRVTGYGRDTWYKTPLDKSYGIAGVKALCVRGDTVYYWSNRGPIRCQATQNPEPLWQQIENSLVGLINPQRIVAGYDLASDLVMFVYDAGNGVRTWAGFDAMREIWVGPDDDMGLVINCAGSVAPIFASTVNAPAGSVGPAGPPTSPSTTGVGAISAIANWVAGDVAAQTSVEYRRQGDTTFIATLVAAGVQTYQFSGLSPGVAYEWRAAHFKGGQLSSYLGPSAGTQFTTGTTVLIPTNLAVSQVGQGSGYVDIGITWTPGEPGETTTLWLHNIIDIPVQVINPPGASATYRVTSTATYCFKVSASASGATSSALTTSQCLAVTVT